MFKINLKTVSILTLLISLSPKPAISLPPAPPCPLGLHCASGLNLPAWSERWVNENTNRIEAAFKYRQQMYESWNKYDSKGITANATEEDLQKWQAMIEPRLYELSSYCKTLDKNLRGVAKEYDILPEIIGRGCEYLKGGINMGPFLSSQGLEPCDDLEVCLERVQENGIYYKKKNSKVLIEKELKPILKNIALDFYLSTGKKFVVTSAKRSYQEQSHEWVKKFYPLTQKTEGDIRSTYTALDPETLNTLVDVLRDTQSAHVEDDLADAMEDAYENGHPPSRHLSNQAFDIRILDEKYFLDFVEACQGSGFFTIKKEPGGEAHWHAQVGSYKRNKDKSPTAYDGRKKY